MNLLCISVQFKCQAGKVDSNSNNEIELKRLVEEIISKCFDNPLIIKVMKYGLHSVGKKKCAVKHKNRIYL